LQPWCTGGDKNVLVCLWAMETDMLSAISRSVAQLVASTRTLTQHCLAGWCPCLASTHGARCGQNEMDLHRVQVHLSGQVITYNY